MIWVTCSSTC